MMDECLADGWPDVICMTEKFPFTGMEGSWLLDRRSLWTILMRFWDPLTRVCKYGIESGVHGSTLGLSDHADEGYDLAEALLALVTFCSKHQYQ